VVPLHRIRFWKGFSRKRPVILVDQPFSRENPTLLDDLRVAKSVRRTALESIFHRFTVNHCCRHSI
jgi:ABC-type thiamine transport system ATPase subunit